jgi:hypothetical protein
MSEPTARRFEVVVEEGVPHGDLYELEQATCHRVVNRLSGQTVLSFEGLLEASLSTDSGMWADYRVSGVREVIVAPDEQSVIVKYFDDREEVVPLPP